MTVKEFKEMLEMTGFPVAYSHFNSKVTAPFITFSFEGSNNFQADNIVFHKVGNLVIELYTTTKNPETEQILETILNEHGFPFDDSETWIPTEKLFQKIYETRFL